MSEQPDPLDLELKALLSVEPSPDLQARVRTRAFATPPKRAPWLAWTSGLAAATAAVLLIAINSGPEEPEVRPGPPVIAETREIPRPIVAAETPIRARGARKSFKPQPNVVLVPAQTATETLPAAEINVQALKGLELKNWIQPIPQAPFSIAGFQEITIEPPTLTVPNLE